MNMLRVAILMLGAVSMTAMAQRKGGDDITGPYNVDVDWPENVCGDGWQSGSTGGVWAESADRVSAERRLFRQRRLPQYARGEVQQGRRRSFAARGATR